MDIPGVTVPRNLPARLATDANFAFLSYHHTNQYESYLNTWKFALLVQGHLVRKKKPNKFIPVKKPMFGCMNNGVLKRLWALAQTKIEPLV